jgi:hypothetical protein
LAVPFAEGKSRWGQTAASRRFDTQKLPPKKAAYGDEGKAVGCVPPTALLCATTPDHVDEDQTRRRLINKENLARPGDQSQLFYLFNLERRIPECHLMRRINPSLPCICLSC